MREPTVKPTLPSWWLEEALAWEGDAPEAPPLEGDHVFDIAIIGGGYTGLWTALHLHERDPSLRIAVVEAEICGWGPSGRNGGFIHGYWTHATRMRSLDRDAARALALAADRIVPGVRDWCQMRSEDVWFRQGGYIKVSTATAQDDVIDRLVEEVHALGGEEEAVPLSVDELAEHCRSPVFRKGAFFRDGATLQPARLARALRRGALDDGIALHERTPVTELKTGRKNVLATPRGRIEAEEIVIAINAAASRWSPVAPYLTPFSSYIVLTEPVPSLIEEMGWTGGESITDGRMFVHYFRTTEDGRVLMGSGGGPLGTGSRFDSTASGDDASAARAESALRRILPSLEGARVERSWGGPIDVSSDHLPFVGTVPGTRVHYGAGYSGSGLGPSWLVGRVLASAVLRADDEWSNLPIATRDRPRLPPRPLRRLGGQLVRSAALACEDAEEHGVQASLPARAATSLPRRIGMKVGTR